MPEFQFRKGAAAIAKAQEDRGKGTFRPFVPKIFWTNPKKDKDSAERYIVFLNPIDEIVQVDMIGFIGDNYEEVIARTDEAIGEGKDPIVEEWGAMPRTTNIGVAVELEPTYEDVKGRKVPNGFEVATREFERKVRDEDGNATDETEEVTTPVIGFVVQSPHNFYNLISSTDATDGPIHEMAMRINRVDENTYSVTPFQGAPVDLSAVGDYVEGISYLGDDMDDVIESLDELGADEAAYLIGEVLLARRLEELCDRDRYDELHESIDKPFRYGTKGKGDKKSGGSKKERPARRSQRRSQAEEVEDTPEVEETVEEKPKARRTRAKKEEVSEEAPKQGNPEALEQLHNLRAKQVAKRKAAA